jgi:hypothetical protein
MLTLSYMKNSKVSAKLTTRLALAGVFMGLGGCNNPCQQLCDEIGSFATECGYSITDDQLDQCIDDHASSELRDGTSEVCDEYKDEVREEWTCDDVAVYFPE